MKKKLLSFEALNSHDKAEVVLGDIIILGGIILVEQLNGFSRKSFNDYTGPENKFNNKNIIFGYNGRGKSSLAYGIFEEYQKKSSIENIRMYNDEYVKNSLLLEDNKGGIKGVVANFGEKAVEIEGEIKGLEKELINLDEKEIEIEKLIKNTRKQIDNIHDKRKGSAKISKKNSSFDLERVFESYQSDLEKAKKLGVKEKELEEIIGDNTLQDRFDLLDNLDTGRIIDFSGKDEWEKILNICSSKYGEIEIPSQTIISWLNDGIHLHENDDKCKFCDNPINYREIESKVKKYNSNEKQKAISLTSDYINDLESYISQVNDFLEKKDYILTIVFDEEIKECFEKIKLLKEELINIIELLKSKLKEMNASIYIENNLVKTVNNIMINFNNVNEVITQKTKQASDLFINQDQLVKGAIALEIEKDSIIKSNLTDINEQKKSLEDYKENNNNKNIKIKELEYSKSDVGDFANLLSKVLESLGIDIDVVLDDSKKNYLLEHSMSDEVLAVDDISEGERNLLSLLFFYYELFKDNEQVSLKNNIDIIVIDDPVSSLDGANRFYVLEMIKTILSQDNVQVFVLTHVWDDFCNLCYGNNKDIYSYFEVYKNNEGESSLRNKKPNENPYRILFQEIFEFSKKSRSEELTDCETYHLPNSMRKVFEEFLSFKSSKNIIPTQSHKAHIEDIMRIQSNGKKQRLAQLLSICNILSHKASHNPEEILESAKFLMSIIETADEKHYYAMRGTN